MLPERTVERSESVSEGTYTSRGRFVKEIPRRAGNDKAGLNDAVSGVLGGVPLGEGVASNKVRARGRLPPFSIPLASR